MKIWIEDVIAKKGNIARGKIKNKCLSSTFSLCCNTVLFPINCTYHLIYKRYYTQIFHVCLKRYTGCQFKNKGLFLHQQHRAPKQQLGMFLESRCRNIYTHPSLISRFCGHNFRRTKEGGRLQRQTVSGLRLAPSSSLGWSWWLESPWRWDGAFRSWGLEAVNHNTVPDHSELGHAIWGRMLHRHPAYLQPG